MKTLIALSLILAANCPANPEIISSQNLRVINVCNVSEQDLQELSPEIAVEFSAGTLLPVGFFLKGDLAKLVGNDLPLAALQIQKTFYVRFTKDELMISEDLTHWKPLLEFFTGNLSTILGIQNGRPTISIEAASYFIRHRRLGADASHDLPTLRKFGQTHCCLDDAFNRIRGMLAGEAARHADPQSEFDSRDRRQYGHALLHVDG